MSARPASPRPRRRAAWMALACVIAAAGVLAVAVAGRGSSAPAGPPQVTLSLTAPTSGAVVGVRVIRVAGTVAPARALVRVAGRRVRVRHGTFSAAVRLDRAMTRIHITARARGFVAASVRTVVHFSARTARGMLVARRASTSGGPAPGLPSTGWFNLGVRFASATGRAHFLASCDGGDSTERPACTCLYTHFVRSGSFSSRAGLEQLYRQTVRAVNDQKVAEMPISLRSGFSQCSSLIFQTANGGGGSSG